MAAWDERFTHIDGRHFKRGQVVDDWFPMDQDVPKSVLDEEKRDDSEEEAGEEENSDNEGEGTKGSGSGSEAESPATSPPEVTDSEFHPHAEKDDHTDSHRPLKSKRSGASPVLSSRIESNWICVRPSIPSYHVLVVPSVH